MPRRWGAAMSSDASQAFLARGRSVGDHHSLSRRAGGQADWSMGDGCPSGSSCAHLSIASCGEDQVGSDAPAAHLRRGSSSDQSGNGGPAGSEGFVLAEHVPDRGGELAGKLDPGNLAATLAAEALLRVCSYRSR
jgi:hypothetical protein